MTRIESGADDVAHVYRGGCAASSYVNGVEPSVEGGLTQV